MQTRLDINTDFGQYIKDFNVVYNKVRRIVFNDLARGRVAEMGKSKYISFICRQYNLLSRTVKSMVMDCDGRINAYFALKKTELKQLEKRITTLKNKIYNKEFRYLQLKKKVAINKAVENELDTYRKLKQSLFYAKRKLSKLETSKLNLKGQLDNGEVSICWGGKSLFSKQHRLQENGYKTHEKWLNDFRKARDYGFVYIGSGDESCGNTMMQLRSIGNNQFSLRMIKEKDFRGDEKYVSTLVTFKYLYNDFIDMLSYNQPITVRVKRKGNKWYLLVSFTVAREILTNSKSGVLGVDYNDGFLALAETDSKGNLVDNCRIDLSYHGTGNKALNEMQQVVHNIVICAKHIGKDIVIEDLNFKYTKCKSGGRNYNRMIHAFDYSRYKFLMDTVSKTYGVKVIKVNPAYTSQIAKNKYCYQRKLNIHIGAAYVIARRGQGFAA